MEKGKQTYISGYNYNVIRSIDGNCKNIRS